MRRIFLVGCLALAMAGCDHSPPTVTVTTPGHNYVIQASSIQRIEAECGVTADEAASIAVARLKANEVWQSKLAKNHANYLQQGGTESQYQAEVVALQRDYGLSRYEAVAEVADFPELPELIEAAAKIGVPQRPAN